MNLASYKTQKRGKRQKDKWFHLHAATGQGARRSSAGTGGAKFSFGGAKLPPHHCVMRITDESYDGNQRGGKGVLAEKHQTRPGGPHQEMRQSKNWRSIANSV